jgi:hypothetical protein
MEVCTPSCRIRGCIQKFPDWVDKEIYAYNNKHSLKSNTKGYGGKLTRLTHKIVIQLHLVAESSTICSSRSRRPVRKLLDTASYIFLNAFYAMLNSSLILILIYCTYKLNVAKLITLQSFHRIKFIYNFSHIPLWTHNIEKYFQQIFRLKFDLHFTPCFNIFLRRAIFRDIDAAICVIILESYK